MMTTSQPRHVCLVLLTTIVVLPLGCRSAGEDRQPAARVLIDDPLCGATRGQLAGGTLTPEGHRPGVGQDHILYVLDRPVVNGVIECEARGMDPNAVPTDGDHGFLAMYDGRGIDEPCRYANDFKQNFYRWNVHWRQNRAAIKCVLSCAAPTEDRRHAGKAVFGEQRDWCEEPTGKTVSWHPDRWHRLRVEWKDKVFRVLVDGDEVWQVEGAYDYAPVQHRIWLGCAPGYVSGDKGKYVCLVPDIVYRNFKLVSYE